MYNNSFVILPTHQDIITFRNTLSMMSIVDYDIDELLNSVISAVTIYHAIDDRCRLYNDQYSTMVPTRDGQILCKAWTTLLGRVKELFTQFNLWDEDGVSWCHYHQLTGNDLMLQKAEYQKRIDPVRDQVLKPYVYPY